MTTLLKAKSAVGTTWAGRILHQQSQTPAPMDAGIIPLHTAVLRTSLKTGQTLPAAEIKTSIPNLLLFVYHDGSALLASVTPQTFDARVYPLLLYVPERTKVLGKSFFLSLNDILSPDTSPRFTDEEKAWTKATFQKDLETFVQKATSIGPSPTPWFFAQDARTPDDIQTLDIFMHGLSLMGVNRWTIKGRMLKPNGKPGPLRIEENKYKSARSLSDLPELRTMFEHPTFPVPLERQIHQGWDFVRSGRDEASFTGMPLHAPLDAPSAHDILASRHLAQEILSATNTCVDSLKNCW